jgi:phenylalanyl-tRNA synthetase beta chain
MKFSEAWLREWTNPEITTTELADQLSMAGLEVDGVGPVAGDFQGVVVGEVLTRKPHPDADKLSVCTVDAAQDEQLQIVCGAKNVAAGMKVAVALVGAVLPGDFKIKRAKLRGVQSLGMICSASELGLIESSDGIMQLPADAAIGKDLRSYLNLDDSYIEVDLTPDRGDCLSIAGIARDVGVINRCGVTAPIIDLVPSQIDDSFTVKLEAPKACPKYACRIIRNINPNAQTPIWMQEKLRRSEIRSISPVVDVTNYVMMELGQPMHGFDLAKLDTEIQVRMAKAGEKLTMLDGEEQELRDDTLVIADASKPLAMAGIMGGEDSGVTTETRDILLESAFFAPTEIIGKARSYGLHTDSSHRFERGVDPELQVKAIERATALLLDIVGGEPGPVETVSSQEYIEQRPEVILRRARLAKILGVEIGDDLVADILNRLEMQVEQIDEGWKVVAPSCRFDISIEEDLIEEVGRIYGYTEIPMHRSQAATIMRGEPELAFNLQQAKGLLVDRGFQEVITYSFISQEMHDLMGPAHEFVELANPISADMSIMRTSLWPGLLQTALYNQARQQSRVRIFESGLRFVRQDDEIKQDPMLAGLISGENLSEQWGENSRRVDFFDLKGDVEAIIQLTGSSEQYEFVAAEHPSLHPGQAARIMRNGESVGWLGMLHPALGDKLDLSGDTFLFEIKLDLMFGEQLPAFTPLSKFPSIRRDLSIMVDESVTFSQVSDCIRQVAPEILQEIRLFDVYTGKNIDFGRKSLALGLILQETSHNLTDEDAEGVMARIHHTLCIFICKIVRSFL